VSSSLRRAAVILFTLAAVYVVYFHGLNGVGLLGPDEPRYAAIARAMELSGDWVTPRLWGSPWFEKPALTYWLGAAGSALGLPGDVAPRGPVAALSVAFLGFFYWMARREFGPGAAAYATIVLGTCAGWLAYSRIAVTDLPLAVFTSASLLAVLPWMRGESGRWALMAGVLLGVAALAKGLVPLVLAIPFLWAVWVRRKASQPVARGVAWFALAFAAAAVPWFALVIARNGNAFVQEFFWKHHLERFASGSLQHGQPFWFYLPVLLGGLFPWSVLLLLLPESGWHKDARRKLLLIFVLFGFVFFSTSVNKLPGYLLPLVPAVALLAGLRLAELPVAGPFLAGSGMLVGLAPVAARVLPKAIESGITKSALPELDIRWLLGAVFFAGAVTWLDRHGRRGAAVALLGTLTAAAVWLVQREVFPVLEQRVSARQVWNTFEAKRGQLCIAGIHRNFRYGLNYYAGEELPDCTATPKPWRIEQSPGAVPRLVEVPR